MTKAQIHALESIARQLGVSVAPFVAWAISTNQDFSVLVDAAYGNSGSAVVASFLNSL